MKKLSFQMAFGGIITALCIILMFSVGVFQVMLYVFPMLSSLLIYALGYECGNKTAMVSYVSVSLLSLILSPEKESAVIFMAFFGYYPILNTYIDRIKSSVLRWAIRFAVFNTAMVISYYALIKLFSAVTLDEFGSWTVPVMLASGNLIMVLYVFAIMSVSAIYVKKIRRKIFKRK